MAKLACYFLGNDQPRVLDSDRYPLDYVWLVGRATGCAIHFSDPLCSKQHARIRHEEESGCWQVLDAGSTNGTYRNGKRLAPRQWTAIQEGDRIDFGAPGARIRFSYNIDDTLSAESNDDEPTGALAPGQLPTVPPSVAAPKEQSLWTVIADGLNWVQGARSWREALYRLSVVSPFILISLVASGIALALILR